jgi:hypothetical protein
MLIIGDNKMNTINKIKNDIDKIENIYGVEVAL